MLRLPEVLCLCAFYDAVVLMEWTCCSVILPRPLWEALLESIESDLQGKGQHGVHCASLFEA